MATLGKPTPSTSGGRSLKSLPLPTLDAEERACMEQLQAVQAARKAPIATDREDSLTCQRFELKEAVQPRPHPAAGSKPAALVAAKQLNEELKRQVEGAMATLAGKVSSGMSPAHVGSAFKSTHGTVWKDAVAERKLRLKDHKFQRYIDAMQKSGMRAEGSAPTQSVTPLETEINPK